MYTISVLLLIICTGYQCLPLLHIRNAIFRLHRSHNNGKILVSFDVISLFTKILVNLAIKVAQERLHKLQNLNELTKSSVKDICNGLQICLEATYLTFRKQFFKHIFGTAMGSPVSVVVANLVMEDVETRAIETFAHPPQTLAMLR